MIDLIEIGKQVLNGGGMAAFISLLVILALPRLRKKVFGNGVLSDENTKQLADKMRANHFHEWENEMKEVKEDIRGIHIELSTMNRRVGFLEGRINGK